MGPIKATQEENRWDSEKNKELLDAYVAALCGGLRPEFRISDLDKAVF